MKKALLFWSMYMFSRISFAQYPTAPGTFTVSPYQSSNMYTNGGSIKAEIPPWTIAGGWPLTPQKRTPSVFETETGATEGVFPNPTWGPVKLSCRRESVYDGI